MDFNYTKKELSAVSGFSGLCLGLVVAAGVPSLTTVAIGGLISIPMIGGFLAITDGKRSKKYSELESKFLATVRKLDSANLKIKQYESDLADLMKQNEQIKIIKSALELCQSEHKKSFDYASELASQLEALKTENTENHDEIADLEAQCADWLETFEKKLADAVADAVALEVQKRQNTIIEANFQEHNGMTTEAIQIAKAYQEAAKDMVMRFIEKNEAIADTRRIYQHNLKDFSQSFNDTLAKVEETNLNQIEQLQERLAVALQKVTALENQDLLEPEYLECGFDQNGKIANAIANWLWLNRQIPLKVTGFESKSDSSLIAGFTYGRSMPLEALVKQIERDSSDIARHLGLYAIEKPQKLQVTDCLTISIKRERPAKKAASGSLYRSKEDFIKFVMAQRCFFRLVGKPGAGKTPSLMVILSHLLERGFLNGNTPDGQKLAYTLIEFCNPLEGISVKNGDETAIFHKWSDPKEALKALQSEYKFRKDLANKNYKDTVGYLWCCDEFDNAVAGMGKTELSNFMKTLRDGGHTNMGAIILGQSVMVSKSVAFTIEDQKFFTNILLDSVSIRTFLIEYGEKFYSSKAVEVALATLEAIEAEIEETNEYICDTARQLRVAMVIADKSPVFYQLPYFDSVSIEPQEYQESLVVINNSRATTPKNSATEQTPKILTEQGFKQVGVGGCLAPMCGKCGSPLRRNGKSSSGTQKYCCKNPDCKK